MAEISSEFENDKLETSSADEIVLYTSKNTVVKKIRIFGKWRISKEIAPEYTFDAKHRQSLNQEFEIGYQLDHPNIVSYIDKRVSDDGVPRLILEYVDGFTLREMMDGDTLVSQKEFDSIFLDVLSALVYLHRQQVYHLDIKPENIVVTHKEHVAKLIDFGFAITASNDKTLGTTKKYVAPEFSERTVEISGQTDMYAFAKTMQEFSERKSLTLSSRQKQIIKSALQQDAASRITADEALLLLQKPQRKGWVIVILLAMLAVFGVLLVLLRKEQKVESPQITHDTVIIEKQQVKDTVLNTTIPYVEQQKKEIVRKQEEPSEKKVAPKRTVANQSAEVVEEIEYAASVEPQTSEIDSSFCTKRIPYSKPNLKKVKYNEKDSLFIVAKEQEYQVHKKQFDSKYNPLTIRQGNAKMRITKQYQRINTSEMSYWEIDKLEREMKDELREIDDEYNEIYRPLIDTLKRYLKQRNYAIKMHLKPHYDSGDIDTYNYYSHDFLEKITNMED